jgi:hypothetical protein
MAQPLDSPRIANATTEPEEHGEIKVTPEMIAAGVSAISEWADFDEMVAEIYVAMESVRRGSAR